MGDYKKATLYKMEEIESVCPPKHIDTDTFTLTPEETGVKSFVLFCSEIHPGGEAEPDVHPGREHCYFMISGTGEATVDGEKFTVRPGTCLWIPPGAEHGIKPVGRETIRFVIVTAPAPWVEV